MKRMQMVSTVIAAAAVCLLTSGCPTGALGTFDIYIVNATDGLTVGLVGLDDHTGKALVDVLDENVPPDTMKVLKVSQATYGDESGSVQIGVVNVGFSQIEGVTLGPDPVVILVESNGENVSLRALNYQ